MKIGNPQDINGNPLLVKIEVDSNYISGNGTVSNVLTFAGFPAVDSSEQVIISKARQVKAGTGIFFSSSANELIINANPATDISNYVVRVINSNSTDNKIPTAKSVYKFVNSNFIKLNNGKIDSSLIDKSDSSTYGVVKVGSGISVSSGIISVPVVVSNLANNVNNPVAGKVIYSALNEKINKPSTGGQLGKVLSFKNNLQTVWIEQVKIPGSISKFPQNLGNAGQILKVNNYATAVEWSDFQQMALDNKIISNGSNAVAGSAIYSYVNSHIDNSSIHLPSDGNSGQILTKTNNSIVWADQIKVDEQIISGSNNAVAGKAVYESLNGKIDRPSMINGAGYVLTVNASENGFELNPIDNTLNENSVHAIQNKTVYSALESKVDLDLLNNYATSLEFDINNNNYVISAVLKHNNDILSSKTIDLPLQTMVISAYYQSATKNLILTLKNNETVSCSVEDIIDGLVSENRTINGKSLNADINLYGTDIKINDQINAKTIYESLNEKGDMFLSDYVNQGGQGIVLSAYNASRAQIANYASNVDWINVNNKPNEFNPVSHNHEVEEINDFDGIVSSIVSGMVQNISASIAQIASSAGHAEIAQFASNAGYAQEVGQHNHNAVQITDFDSNVSSIVSGMIQNISAQIASNANHASNADIAEYASSAGYAQEVGQHNHNTVQITDFSSNVSSIIINTKATSSNFGVIKIGSGLNIDSNGNLSVDIGYGLDFSENKIIVTATSSGEGNAEFIYWDNVLSKPQEFASVQNFTSSVSSIVSEIMTSNIIPGNIDIATTSSLGIVKIGSGLNIDSNGNLNVDQKSNELIFKIPKIETGEFYHLNIEFAENDIFNSIVSYNTYSSAVGFKVFTGLAMVNFPSQGLGIQFSEEQVKFDISNINYKYYRFQWLVGYDENPSQLQGGRYGYGQTNGLLNVFDSPEYESSNENNASNADIAEYASSAGYVDWENVDNKPIATSSSLGLIIIGSGLSIDEFGVVNVEGTINISEEIQLGVVNNNGQFQPLSFEGTSSVESGNPQNVESYKSWNIPEGYGIYQNKTFDLTASNNNYITWSGTVATIQHDMNCIPIVTIYNNNLKQVFLSAEIKTANTVDIDFEEIINGTWKIIFSYGCSFN